MSSFPGNPSTCVTTARAASQTESVFVSTIGVSIVPSSTTWVEPASLPKAFPIWTAPGTFSWKRFRSCGRIAVTPVRTESPSWSVT